MTHDFKKALEELPKGDDFDSHVGHESSDYLYVYGEAIRAALQSQIWQPIETAPRDGTRIIGFVYDRSQTMRFSKHGRRFVAVAGTYTLGNPTHWLPLPSPPPAISREEVG